MKFLNVTLLSLLLATMFYSIESQARPYGESSVRFCTTSTPIEFPNPFELVEAKIYDTTASKTYLRLNLQSKHWFTTILTGGAFNVHNAANTSRYRNSLLISHNTDHPYHELSYPARIWHVDTWGMFEDCGSIRGSFSRAGVRKFYEVSVEQHGCGSTTKRAGAAS